MMIQANNLKNGIKEMGEMKREYSTISIVQPAKTSLTGHFSGDLNEVRDVLCKSIMQAEHSRQSKCKGPEVRICTVYLMNSQMRHDGDWNIISPSCFFSAFETPIRL